MTDSIYWIWFQRMFGVGSRRAHALLEYFEGPEEIWRDIQSGGRAYGMLRAEELAAAAPCMEWAGETQRRTLRKGCEIVTPEHPDYPPLLQNIFSKPAVLYVKGDLSCLRGVLVIGMVGTRNYSDYGRDAARSLAGELAESGAVVVSGLARGVDTFCHEAALDAGGKSIGILGCGIDIDYPAGSAAIKRRMSQNGAVISEYPLGAEPSQWNFPLRNRLISGMSHGVVVVEAGFKSGSMLTAGHAAEQNRELFAVPGSIFEAVGQGANSLIRDGAKLTQCAADILEEFAHLYFVGLRRAPRPTAARPEPGAALAHAQDEMAKGLARARAKAAKISMPPVGDGAPPPADTPRAASTEEAPQTILPGSGPTLPNGCSAQAGEVYALFGGAPVAFEELAAGCALDVPALQTALTELEIYGLIRGQPGRKFSRC